MTLARFQFAAALLIAYCLAGTVVTWIFHLWGPETEWSHSFLQGTEFTSPLVFTASWIVFLAMTFRPGVVGKVGAVLMTISALVYSVGDITEFFKSNVGVSDAKWDFILAATAVGLAIGLAAGITGIGYLWGTWRQSDAPAQADGARAEAS